MEFWIAFTVTFVIGSIITYGKKQNQKTKPNIAPIAKKPNPTTEHQRKLQEADELITVILPTINNDK